MSNKRNRESIVDLSLQEAVRNAEEDNGLLESSARAAKINQVLSKFNDEELTRFEYYMRSHLRKNKVKDILRETLGTKYNVTDEICIAVGGLAKLFVGELMNYSMEVLEQQHQQDSKNNENTNIDNNNNNNNNNDNNYTNKSLRIEHIEEAVFRMRKEGKIGRSSEDSFLFSKQNIKSESLATELSNDQNFFMDYSDNDDDDNNNNNNNNNNDNSN